MAPALFGLWLSALPAPAQSILERVLADIAADRPAGDTEVMLNIAEVISPANDASILNRIDGSVTIETQAPVLAMTLVGETGTTGVADLTWHEVQTRSIASSNTGMITVQHSLPAATPALTDPALASATAATGAGQAGGYAVLLGNLATATANLVGSISLRTETAADSGAGIVRQATSSIGTINSGGITLRITQDGGSAAQ